MSDSPSGSEAPASFAAVVASDPPAEPEAAHHAAPTAPLDDAPAPALAEEVAQVWPTPAEAEGADADTPPTPTPAAAAPRASQQPPPTPATPADAPAASAAAAAATSPAAPEAEGAAKVEPKGLGAGLRKPKARKNEASSSAAGSSSGSGAATAPRAQPRAGKAGGKAAGGAGGSRGLDLKDKGFSLEEIGVDHPLEESSDWESASEDEGSAALGSAASPAGHAGRPAPGPSRLQAEAQRVKEGSRAWAASLTDLFDQRTLIMCGAVLTTCAAGLLLLGARAAVRRWR